MKQILLVTLFSISTYLTAVGDIIWSNWPCMNANAGCIFECGNKIKIDIYVDYTQFRLAAGPSWRIEFSSNHGDITVQFSDFNEIDNSGIYTNRIELSKGTDSFIDYSVQLFDSPDAVVDEEADFKDICPFAQILFGPRPIFLPKLSNQNSQNDPIKNTNQSALEESFSKVSQNTQIKVFPKPFYNKLTIQCDTSLKEKILMEIYDLNGVLKYSKELNASHQLNKFQENIYDINLLKGVYICKIYSKNFKKLFRLVKTE